MHGVQQLKKMIVSPHRGLDEGMSANIHVIWKNQAIKKLSSEVYRSAGLRDGLISRYTLI